MQNQRWSYLKKGDTVEVIAPSGRFEFSVLEEIKKFLTDLGLNYHIPDNILGDDLLCANSEAMRFEQLKQALLNKNSQAVWCVRGGYGATKLLPLLNQVQPPPHAKLFIGFSDITALHIFLQQKWHWTTLHGASLEQCAMKKISRKSIDCLLQVILGADTHITKPYAKLIPLNKLANENRLIHSTIVGGNLCLVQTSIGTGWQIQPYDKILFLEDVGERGYRVDRMLEQLKQAGIFSGIKALLLGDFTDGKDPDGKNLVPAVLERFAQQSNFPVLQCSGIGHGKTNNPLPLGTHVVLQLGDAAQLSCETGGV